MRKGEFFGIFNKALSLEPGTAAAAYLLVPIAFAAKNAICRASVMDIS